MSVNNFLPFASELGANVVNQTDYESTDFDTLRANGFTTGTAQSIKVNKVLRQPSVMAFAIGQMIADSGFDALDNGDLGTLVDNLKAAILATAGTAIHSEDSKWAMMPIGVPTAFIESVVDVDIGTWLTAHTDWRLLTDVIGAAAGRALVVAGGSHAAMSTFGSADAIVVTHSHNVNDHNHSITDEGHSHVVPLGTGSSGVVAGAAPSSPAPPSGTETAVTGITIDDKTGLTTQDAGGSGVDANLPPSIAVIWIIKVS